MRGLESGGNRVRERARPGAGPTWRFGLILLGVASGFVWYSGTSLLRLRAWARTSIEVISWLALVAFLCLGAYVMAILNRQPEVFFAGVPVPIGPVLLAVSGASVAVLIVMVRLLRGRTIRDAVRGRD